MNAEIAALFLRRVAINKDGRFFMRPIAHEIGCDRRAIARVRGELEEHFRMRFSYDYNLGWIVDDWGYIDPCNIKATLYSP
jgi:hypothetical protein